MRLKSISDPKMKTYTMLNYSPPSLHQSIYNLCAPENPTDKNYKELSEILKDYLEPQPSKWACQNKCIIRVQKENESTMEFAAELQKQTAKCNFFSSCKKSIAEIVLKIQFVRGVKDTSTRQNLLMDKMLGDIVGVKSFFDDILVVRKTQQETLIYLKTGFDRLRQHNIRLNQEKCKHLSEKHTILRTHHK